MDESGPVSGQMEAGGQRTSRQADPRVLPPPPPGPPGAGRVRRKAAGAVWTYVQPGLGRGLDVRPAGRGGAVDEVVVEPDAQRIVGRGHECVLRVVRNRPPVVYGFTPAAQRRSRLVLCRRWARAH